MGSYKRRDEQAIGDMLRVDPEGQKVRKSADHEEGVEIEELGLLFTPSTRWPTPGLMTGLLLEHV